MPTNCWPSMNILPAKTDLPATQIARRHNPRIGAYPTYRPCLRWEFGFTCAFCFLHEADFVAHGIERTGFTGVEHHVPRRSAPQLADEYGNCFYACRFCNRARSRAPNVDANGRRLLEPCTTAWAARFHQHGFSFQPCDSDAEYSAEVYDLNDPRKREMRRSRAGSIGRALRLLADGPDRARRLLSVAERLPHGDRTVVLEAAEAVHDQVVAARQELVRFRMVPADADETCRCDQNVARQLPSFLAKQAIEVLPP